MRAWVLSLAGSICMLALGDSETSPAVVLDNGHMRMTINRQGGAISSCVLTHQDLNPFSWKANRRSPEDSSRKEGFFICFDRIGKTTPEEKKLGIPFHGEATSVPWEVIRQYVSERGDHSLEMQCRLPIANMSLVRTYCLLKGAAVCSITDRVTNHNTCRKPYNMLQHPSLGPPFLDESVIVDSNAFRGFMHNNDLSKVPGKITSWPFVQAGDEWFNLRYMTDGPSGVANYVLAEDEEWGWGCVSNPEKQLLVGCLWSAKEYPWTRVWRVRRNEEPCALGVEFSTTSLGVPLEVIEERGKVLGTSTLEYLESDASISRTFYLYLKEIPEDYEGVERVFLENGSVTVVPCGAVE